MSPWGDVDRSQIQIPSPNGTAQSAVDLEATGKSPRLYVIARASTPNEGRSLSLRGNGGRSLSPKARVISEG